MRPSKAIAKWRRGEPVLFPLFHLTDPQHFEILGLMGHDGVWMDLEHHFYSEQTAGELIRVARMGGCDVIARAAKGEWARMARLLEAGASGLMVPRIENADEARECVQWTRFPPIGVRGFDGGNPDMPYSSIPPDEYIRIANDQTYVIIQIESPSALDHVDEIAAVDGVDGLMLGPGDFSILAGVPGQMDHNLIHDAERRIAAAAKAAGKVWGRPIGSPGQCKQLMDMGASFFFYGADLMMIIQGLKDTQAQFTPLGFTFDNQLTRPGTVYEVD